MTIRKRLALALIAAAVLAINTGAFAQQSQNDDRGIVPGKTYQQGDLDTINLFNGNLNLSIPIGQTYRVGGQVAYGFTMQDNRQWTQFRTDALDTRYPKGRLPYADAFIEYRPAANQTLTLKFRDVSNAGGGRNLVEFFPNRTAGDPSVLDHRFRNSHIAVGLTFKQSFGGGGVAK